MWWLTSVILANAFQGTARTHPTQAAHPLSRLPLVLPIREGRPCPGSTFLLQDVTGKMQNRRYDAKANNTADITSQETPAISTQAHNCKLPGLQPAAPLREAGIPQKLPQPCWWLVSNSKTSTPAKSLHNQPLPTGTDRPRAQVKSYLQNSPRPWKGAAVLLSDFLRKTMTMVEAQPSCCAPSTSTSSPVNYLHFHQWLLFCSSSSP